ncbi:MAG TPA: YdaU family protein [Rhodocyclaceae bacterium]|nr:YdaU family protein [Rhodocyclaceae bacterium]
MNRRPTANPPRPFRYSVHLPNLIADTVHLDPEAFGCYMRLLMSYWRNGPPADDDRMLARIVGLTYDEWCAVRPDVEPYFDVLHGQWLHWRTDEDLEAAYTAINANKARTQAATAARKARAKGRDVERHDARNDERHDADLCNQRDVERNEHLNVSLHTTHASPSERPKAQAKAKMDFEDDVRIAERDLGIGGGQ